MSAGLQKRVLVVEDDDDLRGMVSALLRQRLLAVDAAAGGAEAIALLGANQYSVILLDLLMPEPDGFAVLRAFDDKTISVPPVVLVVTGADQNVVDRLDSDRIHGIVRKPFDPDELALLVMACADIRSRSNFGMMAVAMLSGARLLDLLQRWP